jgi:magnesium-transporting ATPase (P-type)
MDKSSSLGMPMSPQEISKKYKLQSLGMPKAPLLHQQKYQVIFQDTIFLLLHMLCVFLGASLFLLSVFFVCCNKWLDPNIFILEKTHSIFIAQNTLVFTFIIQRVFSFASTVFSFCFLPLLLFITC